jgi:hypothetical protein
MQTTRIQKSIVKALGVSAAGLTVLCKQVAGRDAWGGIAGSKLVCQGHLDGFGNITNTGRAVVARARQMGW